MTRGVKVGIVTVKTLKELLGLPKSNKTLLPELLRLARINNLISNEEFDKTSPTRNVVVKCYLYSVIENKRQRDQVEKYVIAYSKLYSRGSFIANLIALDKFGVINGPDAIVRRYIESKNISEPFFDFIETKNSTLKQCFLHERWPSSKQERIADITTVLPLLQVEMSRLCPNWLDIMSVSGWDNAISNMYTKFRANLENHIVVHLPQSLNLYLERVEIEKGTHRPLLKQLFFKGLRPFSECHNNDYINIINLRKAVGQGHSRLHYNMYKKFFYTADTFDLSIFLKKSLGHESYFPISILGRKYAYIDHKIASFLLRDRTSKTLANILHFTPQKFDKKRKQLRKRLRQKYNSSGKSMQEKKKFKKLREKWFRTGASKFPKGEFDSIETDGVGLSMVIKLPIHNNKSTSDTVPIQDQVIDMFMDKPVRIGIDTGRAKLFTAAISTSPTMKPKSLMFTRGKYYYEIKNKIRERWEHSRTNVPDVQNAIALLSLHSKILDLPGYIASVSENYDVLSTEYFSKERALWRMRLYRLKKRSLGRAVQEIFKAANKQPILLGIGDGGFPCTGRGEQAVPTTGLMVEIFKARKRYKNKVTVISIDEFRTTMCCCACGAVTEQPLTTKGVRSRRLRFCSQCNQINGKGLRDRDIQAARNMLWLVEMQHLGLPRPSYLCRPTH